MRIVCRWPPRTRLHHFAPRLIRREVDALGAAFLMNVLNIG